MLGETVPTWDYMTPAELHATVNGKYRGDGRRLDQYVSAEPLHVNIEEN